MCTHTHTYIYIYINAVNCPPDPTSQSIRHLLGRHRGTLVGEVGRRVPEGVRGHVYLGPRPPLVSPVQRLGNPGERPGSVPCEVPGSLEEVAEVGPPGQARSQEPPLDVGEAPVEAGGPVVVVALAVGLVPGVGVDDVGGLHERVQGSLQGGPG